MPRTWASGDNVFVPIGGLVGIGSSANTLVAIAKKASDSSWMTPTAIQPSAGNPTVSMQCSNVNKLSYVSGATDKDTGITWQASDGWSLIAVDKDAATATPNGHLYVYSTDTWTHSAAGSTVGGNSTDLTGGKVQHGRWATSDPFIGDIAIAGIWKRQLTQTQIEYLAFSLQAWYAAAPDYLVIFDQAATSQNVIDLITGNTEQSHSGAAIGTSSLPVFSYGFTVPVPSAVASAGGSGATVTPSAISCSTSMPAATVATGSTVIAAAITCSTSMPAATVATGSTVTAAAIAGTTSMPAATVATGSTVIAAAISSTTNMPAPSVATGSTVLAAAIACSTSMPAPSVQAGGATIAVGSAIACSTSMPAPTLAVGSRVVLGAAIACSTSMPSVTVTVPAAGMTGRLHGPLPLALGSVTVHTGNIVGAIT